MYQCISREFRLDPGCAEEVEIDISLWYEEVPTIGREVRVCPTQHCNEMVLKCLYGTFGRIGAVVPWG